MAIATTAILGGTVTALQPQVNFGSMTDYDIVEFGLDGAEKSFLALVEEGATSNDSLYINVGEIIDGEFRTMGVRAIGPDAAEFSMNVSHENGKVATVVEYRCDSITASRLAGDRDKIPNGPRRWTGGVYHLAQVEINGAWIERAFAGAASGIQGHFDMATVYVALTRMGAAWALQQKAWTSMK